MSTSPRQREKAYTLTGTLYAPEEREDHLGRVYGYAKFEYFDKKQGRVLTRSMVAFTGAYNQARQAGLWADGTHDQFYVVFRRSSEGNSLKLISAGPKPKKELAAAATASASELRMAA